MMVLYHRLGSSVGLPVALMAWPSKWVVLIGAFVASTVAGLQSLARYVMLVCGCMCCGLLFL